MVMFKFKILNLNKEINKINNHLTLIPTLITVGPNLIFFNFKSFRRRDGGFVKLINKLEPIFVNFFSEYFYDQFYFFLEKVNQKNCFINSSKMQNNNVLFDKSLLKLLIEKNFSFNLFFSLNKNFLSSSYNKQFY
jgi:hypothetical protein